MPIFTAPALLNFVDRERDPSRVSKSRHLLFPCLRQRSPAPARRRMIVAVRAHGYYKKNQQSGITYVALFRILARPFTPPIHRPSACLGMRRRGRRSFSRPWRRPATHGLAGTGGTFHCLCRDRFPVRAGLPRITPKDVGADRPGNRQRGLRGFAELRAGTVGKLARRSGEFVWRCVRTPVGRNSERHRLADEPGAVRERKARRQMCDSRL